MYIHWFRPSFFNSDLPSIYLIRSGDGRISSSSRPRWDLVFDRCKERGQLKSWVQRLKCYSTSRMCGGWGMPLWAALPRHETVVYIIFQCMNTTRKDVCSIYLIYVAYIYIRVYMFLCSISISIHPIFHRYISSSIHSSIYLIRSGDDRTSSFHSSTVGSLVPSLQRKRTTEKMSAKNGDI